MACLSSHRCTIVAPSHRSLTEPQNIKASVSSDLSKELSWALKNLKIVKFMPFLYLFYNFFVVIVFLRAYTSF